MLGPGAETSALPHPSLPGSTGYDAVQNRFSGQVGVGPIKDEKEEKNYKKNG